MTFPQCGSDIAELTLEKENVTHDFSVVFSVVFIIDKCPSLASNPIDTSTLTLTSLHLQYSDMPAHIYSVFLLIGLHDIEKNNIAKLTIGVFNKKIIRVLDKLFTETNSNLK